VKYLSFEIKIPVRQSTTRRAYLDIRRQSDIYNKAIKEKKEVIFLFDYYDNKPVILGYKKIARYKKL